MSDPSLMEAVATTSNGKILRTFLTPNAHTRGFRAGVDVAVDLRPEHRPAGVFARWIEGADGNLDLPLAGVRETWFSAASRQGLLRSKTCGPPSGGLPIGRRADI